MEFQDIDQICYRVDRIREAFNELADCIFTTYEDFGVDKEYWSETGTMISNLSLDLLNLTKPSSPYFDVSEEILEKRRQMGHESLYEGAAPYEVEDTKEGRLALVDIQAVRRKI